MWFYVTKFQGHGCIVSSSRPHVMAMGMTFHCTHAWSVVRKNKALHQHVQKLNEHQWDKEAYGSPDVNHSTVPLFLFITKTSNLLNRSWCVCQFTKLTGSIHKKRILLIPQSLEWRIWSDCVCACAHEIVTPIRANSTLQERDCEISAGHTVLTTAEYCKHPQPRGPNRKRAWSDSSPVDSDGQFM